jgi:hypothetical protein
MTEAEAGEVIDRYEALVVAVTGGDAHFETPLDLVNGRLWATQTERQVPEGSWLPRMRSKSVQELPSL